MFGLEFDENGSGIDANFTSVAYLRKGVINGGLQEISCNIDEVVVVRATNSCLITCYMVVKNGDSLTYKLNVVAATDFSFSAPSESSVIFNRPYGYSLQVEYFIFGSPRREQDEYGINVFNDIGEVVFSSANKYLSPIAMSRITPDGRTIGHEENASSGKCGVMLNMSNVFIAPHLQRQNGIRIAQTAIAFEPFSGGRRNIGIYIMPASVPGVGESAILTGEISAMVVQLQGLY
mgnify:CR=1 FL=1